MSRSASKLSAQKDLSSLKNRRAASVDTRSRGSYVPEKRRPSSEERKSGNSGYNRLSGARKISINLSEAKRKDTRPLTDKAYQKKKICDLVKFLEETGFKYPVTVGKLMSPSKKDFENIFQYLYNCFDPTYEVKKIEEEAPKILKNLGYPFTINKSAFVYVARTNWPSLLGALIWLLDLNKFVMKVDMKALFECGEDEERAEIHSILLRYICQCYHSGNDDEEEEDALFTQIIKSTMKDDMDELMAQNREKKLLVESVEKELNEIKSLSEQNVSLETNIKKYEEYSSNMKSHTQNTKELYEKLLAELQEKESELSRLQEEVSKQQDLYDAQGFDGKKQLDYFESQKKELIKNLDEKRDVFRKLQDKYWEAEIQFKQNFDKATAALESFIELYNTRIEEARCVLHPLQNIKNSQVQKLCNSYHMDFPSWEILPGKSQPDWNSIQQNALESILGKLRNANECFKSVLTSQNEKLSEIHTRKSDLAMELKLLTVRESQSENDINWKEKQAVDEISSLEASIEKLSANIKSLQDESKNLDNIRRRMTKEFELLHAHREKLEQDLQLYSMEQQNLFELFSKEEENAVELILASGAEILQALEELKKLKD